MTPGKIILHPNFVFHDGAVSNKILISLGTKDDTTVFVKTTSKGYRYDHTFGCQCKHRFPNFHLVQNCCLLAKPTWVCLNEYYEFDRRTLEIKYASGDYKFIGDLNQDLTDRLVQCAIETDDISIHQEKIVRAANRL